MEIWKNSIANTKKAIFVIEKSQKKFIGRQWDSNPQLLDVYFCTFFTKWGAKLALFWALTLDPAYPGPWFLLPEDRIIKPLHFYKGPAALGCPKSIYKGLKQSILT